MWFCQLIFKHPASIAAAFKAKALTSWKCTISVHESNDEYLNNIEHFSKQKSKGFTTYSQTQE